MTLDFVVTFLSVMLQHVMIAIITIITLATIGITNKLTVLPSVLSLIYCPPNSIPCPAYLSAWGPTTRLHGSALGGLPSGRSACHSIPSLPLAAGELSLRQSLPSPWLLYLERPVGAGGSSTGVQWLDTTPGEHYHFTAHDNGQHTPTPLSDSHLPRLPTSKRNTGIPCVACVSKFSRERWTTYACV